MSTLLHLPTIDTLTVSGDINKRQSSSSNRCYFILCLLAGPFVYLIL
jgi:hypothetical protein